MIKLSKLFLILILVFCSSCRDGDKLTDIDGYNVGTYYIDGAYNGNPIYESDYLSDSWGGVSQAYFDDNPFNNNPVVGDQLSDLNILFQLEMGPFKLRDLQLNDVLISALSKKTINFDDPAISNQNNLIVSNLNINTSYLEIDTVILPNNRYVFPRIIGSIYLESDLSSNADKLEIHQFELPFNNY